MNGRIEASSPDPAPVPVPTSKKSPPRPIPLPEEVNLPSFVEATDASNVRRHKVLWALFGGEGYCVILFGSMSLPGVDCVFCMIYITPLFAICLFPACYYTIYYAWVSHLMPSKPVGRYTKHGLQLIALSYALLVQWIDGGDLDKRFSGASFVTGFNMLVHTMYRLTRHPADLGWLDFFLVEVMQFVVMAWGENSIHAVLATYMVCLVVICCRFYFYTCPETSDAPVGIIEKFGSEKAV